VKTQKAKHRPTGKKQRGKKLYRNQLEVAGNFIWGGAIPQKVLGTSWSSSLTLLTVFDAGNQNMKISHNSPADSWQVRFMVGSKRHFGAPSPCLKPSLLKMWNCKWQACWRWKSSSSSYMIRTKWNCMWRKVSAWKRYADKLQLAVILRPLVHPTPWWTPRHTDRERKGTPPRVGWHPPCSKSWKIPWQLDS